MVEGRGEMEIEAVDVGKLRPRLSFDGGEVPECAGELYLSGTIHKRAEGNSI
jgi:hypothetical protein